MSPNLQKETEIAVYGYFGYALLMFPTAASGFLEYEQNHLIDCIAGFINNGTLKAYTVDGINRESWLDKNIHVTEKIRRQMLYNKYIEDEVISFINSDCGGSVPVIVSGASLGAFQAANAFFRRPALYAGLIVMSGSYDLKPYTEGYFNDDCYFNSPVDFMANLTDEEILNRMRNKNIIISSGQGKNEDPDASKELSDILNSKGINHWLDLWGYDVEHDWPAWHKMLPYYLNNINV